MDFWDWVSKHYNQNHPNGLTTMLATSLGMKWGTIKLDVVKFIVKYKIIQTLQEYGTNTKDTIQKKLWGFTNQNMHANNCLALIIV